MKLQQYIKELRRAKGFSQRQLAQMAGVSNTEIWRIERGEREKPSADTLKKLAPHLGVAVEDLLGAAGYLSDDRPTPSKDNLQAFAEQIYESGQGEYPAQKSTSIVLSPVVEQITAGPPLSMRDQGQFYPLSFEISGDSRLQDYFYFKARGHNMKPTVADGDIVLVRRQSSVENGEIAVLLCTDFQEAVIRRLVFANDSIILSSDNHECLPLLKNNQECSILGRVIKKISPIR